MTQHFFNVRLATKPIRRISHHSVHAVIRQLTHDIKAVALIERPVGHRNTSRENAAHQNGRAKGGPVWDRPAGLLHLRPSGKIEPAAPSSTVAGATGKDSKSTALPSSRAGAVPPKQYGGPQAAKLSTRRARTCTSQLSEAQCRLLSVYCSATASPSGIPRTLRAGVAFRQPRTVPPKQYGG